MAVNVMETQATILKVAQQGRGRITIEADIPALGQFPTRFISWASSQGNAPAIGAEVIATMEPTNRQKRFITDGTFADDLIDGSEAPWQVNWRMTAARAGTDGETPEPAQTGETTQTAPARPSGTPKAGNGAGWIDAALRHRVDAQAINDREAVRLAIAHGAADGGNIYGDMESVLAEASSIAEWLNTRFAARLAGSPMVAKAQELGATVTKVEEVEEEPQPQSPNGPPIKNEAELRAWVEEKGWSREAVAAAIAEEGFESARDYLAQTGNTALGLASALAKRLGT